MRAARLILGLTAACVLSLSLSGSRVEAQAPTGTDATIASVKTMYEGLKGFITKAAAQIPEDKFSFAPVKGVRTMGQLFGHIANASSLICGTSSGMMMKLSAGDAEKLATKADIQKAIGEAFSACDHGFQMVNAKNAHEPVTLFGQAHTRIGGMAFNNAHMYEHYGNIVTYMRINNLVPPSSGGK